MGITEKMAIQKKSTYKPHSPVKQTGDLDFYRIRSNDGYVRYEIYVQNPDFAELSLIFDKPK